MNLKQRKGWVKHADFIILDLICMQVCFCLVYWALNGWSGNPYEEFIYRLLALVIFFSQVAEILFNFNYKGILKRGDLREALYVLSYTLRIAIFTIIFMFLIHQTASVSRLQVGFTFTLFFFVSLAERNINKRILRRRRRREGSCKSLVLITSGKLVDEAIRDLTNPILYVDYFVSGVILTDGDFSSVKGEYSFPIIPLCEAAMKRLRSKWVDEVFILQPSDMPIDKELLNTIAEMGITVNYTLALFTDSDWPLLDLRPLGRYKVLTSSLNFMSPQNAFIKRCMDIAGSIVGCLFTCLLCLFIAPAIYIADPGPIFFKQDRIGRNGKVFKIYKFRSMYKDAEERKAALMAQNKLDSDLMFKMDDDPRIIGSEKKDKNGKPKGIGNFIRNTSIDEFPQFFNVLKGDMSLVGTRPPTLKEFEMYEASHRARMAIKPGITGMWQVSGRSEITDFDEVVRLDREYIENWSLALDLKILLKTVLVVLARKGSE